jgi:G3E family GTPase
MVRSNISHLKLMGPKLIPVILSQSISGCGNGSQRTEWRKALFDSVSELRFVTIEGFPPNSEVSSTEVSSEDTCDQCVITQFILDKVQDFIINLREPSEIDALWVEIPPELDVSRVTKALGQSPSVLLQAVLTTVESDSFLADFTSHSSFEERGIDTVGAQQQSVMIRLVDQIEYCDLVLLLGKKSESVKSIVSKLNPRAHILSIETFATYLRSNKIFFHPEETFQNAGWQCVVKASKQNKSGNCFRARRPFHPKRFNDLIEKWPENILRSQGTIWLASHKDDALTFSQIGPAGFFFSLEGAWLDTLSTSEQQMTLQNHPELKLNWDPYVGDRMIELSFISECPLAEDWQQALEQCLLTEFEMRLDWNRFENPFPTFEELENDVFTDHFAEFNQVEPPQLQLIEPAINDRSKS